MKARFKTMILSALGALTAFTAVTYSSCKPDKCKAIRCANGAVCSDGVCICPTGFEGPQCEVKITDKYVGVWNVLERGTISSTAQYTATIKKNDAPGAGMTDVIIKNFNNYFTNDVAAQVSSDTIYIPQQTVDNYIIQGKGFLTPDKYYNTHGTLTLRYTVQGVAPGSPVNDYGTQFGEPSLWNK